MFCNKKNNSSYILKNSKKEGFTVIELVVVMAIFLFVIGAAMGIFLSVVKSQKRVLSEQQILNQISYVQEYVSKALRTVKTEIEEGPGSCLIDYTLGSQAPSHQGFIYLLTRYDSNKGSFRGIKFINQSDNDACQEFYLDDNGVLKELKTYSPYPEPSDEDALDLTSGNLKIESFGIAINGSESACGNVTQCGASVIDLEQPRVTLYFNISIPGDPQQSTRTFQTTVSRRNLNAK